VAPVKDIKDYFMKHIGAHVLESLKDGSEIEQQLQLLSLLLDKEAGMLEELLLFWITSIHSISLC